MTITAHSLASETFVPLLKGLGRLLDKAADHAQNAGFDTSVLVAARLAPDMFPLSRQVQFACYQARDAFTRLTGGAPGAPVLSEATFGDLQEHVRQTVEALEAVPPSAFDGAEDRAIVIALPGGDMAFEMTGYQLLRDWSIPHFYFHVVTAYDILRHNGVPIGKQDFVANVRDYLRPIAR
jgi:hypothetical protein